MAKTPKRSTFRVDDLKDTINKCLRESTCSPLERDAMSSILESVLMDSGNYRGFRYLTYSEVPLGCEPGIEEQQGSDGILSFTYPDESRRKYF
jgi:hypothetical protein